MKKLFRRLSIILLSTGALLIAPSCNKAPETTTAKQTETQSKHQRHRPAMSRNDENIMWAKFDSLTEEQKQQIINQKRQRIMMRDSITLSHIEEFQAKMKDFDKMSYEEQRALLESREKPQTPLTEEQIADRKKKAEEFRKQHQGEHRHEGHEGHSHQHGE